MQKKQKTKNTPTNRKRTLSRLMAIQIFYQYDFLNRERKPQEIKKDIIENYTLDSEEDISSYREKIDEIFLDNLITGFELDAEKIDAGISEFLKGDWSMDKIDDVTRQILRFSTFELKFMLDIPARVVIDEYVDIAASFEDMKKTTFVNATLDALAKKFRAAEFK